MPPTLIFDGECVLCSGTVRFILERESAPVLHFASTQSAAASALAASRGLDADVLDGTFVLVEEGQALVRSEAALRVASYLRRPWCWLTLLRLVPRPVRDGIYSAIARRRYRLFGRMESCFRPDAASRHRFSLDPAPPHSSRSGEA